MTNKKGLEPDLAIQALVAAWLVVPAKWQERFEYQPHLAESLTDPEVGRLKRGATPMPARQARFGFE